MNIITIDGDVDIIARIAQDYLDIIQDNEFFYDPVEAETVEEPHKLTQPGEVVRALDKDPKLLDNVLKGSMSFKGIDTGELMPPITSLKPFRGLSEEIIESLIPQTFSIELETMCKVGCAECGFTRNPKYRKSEYEQMPVNALRTLARKMGKHHDTTRLFFHSDPFNYNMPPIDGDTENYNYLDLHRMFSLVGNVHVDVSTAVPGQSQELVLEGLKLGYVRRISVLPSQEPRLKKTEFLDDARYISVLRYTKRDLELLGSKYFSKKGEPDMDVFVEVMEESYADSDYGPDPLPEWNSPEVLKEVREFLIDRYNRIIHALKEEPDDLLEDINLHGHVGQLSHMRVIQSGKAYGQSEHLEPPDGGIWPYNGVAITPTNVLNVVQVPVSTQYPDGQVEGPIAGTFSSAQFPEQDTIENVISRGFVVMRDRSRTPQDFTFSVITPDGSIGEYNIVETSLARKMS